MMVRQPAIALARVLAHSEEGAICWSKAAARLARPGITEGAMRSMTLSQFPSLASISVASEIYEVSACASRPLAVRRGARNAMEARVGYWASEKDANPARSGGSASSVAARAASCLAERIMKDLADRAGGGVSEGEVY
jgi:hypothetical protein